jgi:FixJ family two-component response regulator
MVTGSARDVVAGADDDFRVRESSERLMDSAGYATLVFSSAEEFLRSGTLAETTCLITDVRMPGMDGVELQRRVRFEHPELAVILISAHYDKESRLRPHRLPGLNARQLSNLTINCSSGSFPDW